MRDQRPKGEYNSRKRNGRWKSDTAGGYAHMIVGDHHRVDGVGDTAAGGYDMEVGAIYMMVGADDMEAGPDDSDLGQGDTEPPKICTWFLLGVGGAFPAIDLMGSANSKQNILSFPNFRRGKR